MNAFVAAIQNAASVAHGFVREDAPQSAVRAIAILFGITACYCGYKTVAFAFAHPHETASIVALGSTTVGALTGGMATALTVRKRKVDGSPDNSPAPAADGGVQ